MKVEYRNIWINYTQYIYTIYEGRIAGIIYTIYEGGMLEYFMIKYTQYIYTFVC